MITKLINDFLDNFATKVSEDEDDATIELYMDDHDCIEFDKKQYYINKDNSLFNEEDQKLCTMIINTYEL